MTKNSLTTSTFIVILSPRIVKFIFANKILIEKSL